MQSIRRIKRLIWLPVCALALVFIIILTAFLWKDISNVETEVRQLMRDSFASSSKQYIDDILQNRKDALQHRLDVAHRNLKPTHLVCMKVQSLSKGLTVEAGCETFAGRELVPIYKFKMGSDTLATATAGVRLDYLAYEGLLYTLAAFLIAVIITLFVVHKLGILIDDQIVSPLVSQIEKRSKEIGATTTTQMFAHDVRRPLNLVQAFIHRMRESHEREEIEDLLTEYSREIDLSVSQVNAMVTDILSLGKESASPKFAVSPRSVCEEAKRICQQQTSKPLTFTVDYTNEHKVLGVHGELVRLVQNLIANAIQATPRHGRVWIHSDEIRSAIVITVGNSGSYVPTEDRVNIFDMFYTKGKQSGTGLGLAIAKKVVNDHGGTIFCSSERDLGTEFVISLPKSEGLDDYDPRDDIRLVAPPRSPANQVRTRHESGEGFRTILVADDDPFYTDHLRVLLESVSDAKLNIVVAHNPTDVFRACNEYRFELILLDSDFGTKELSGTEITSRLRSENFLGIICLHSNFIDESLRQLAEAAGVDLAIEKPMPKARLSELLNTRISSQGGASFS